MAEIDEAQWLEWYRTLEKPLYSVVYRWLWDAAESQDIVQEAFLRCWRIRGQIDPDGFKSLVFRTALRLASNRRRRQRLWRFVPLGDGTDGNEPRRVSRPDCDPLVERQVRDALDALPEAFKQVLLLSEIAGLSYKEIAQIMSVREGTIGSRRNRALSLLRKGLAVRGVDWDED